MNSSLLLFTYKQLFLYRIHISEKLKYIWYSFFFDFIYGFKNSFYFINLNITIFNLRASLNLLQIYILNNLNIILVSQDFLVRDRINYELKNFVFYGFMYIYNKWIGGILTNFKFFSTFLFPFLITNFRGIVSLISKERLLNSSKSFSVIDLIQTQNDGSYLYFDELIKANLKKKSDFNLIEENYLNTNFFYKLSANKLDWILLYYELKGICFCNFLPSFLISLNANYNFWAILESCRLNIVNVSLVDSKFKEINNLSYKIPSNTDSKISILFYILIFKNSFFLGYFKRLKFFFFLILLNYKFLKKLKYRNKVLYLFFYFSYLKHLILDNF